MNFKKQSLDKLDLLAIKKGNANQSGAWWIEELYVCIETLNIIVIKGTNTLKYFKNGRANMRTVKFYDVLKVDTIENGYIKEAEGSVFNFSNKKAAKECLKGLIKVSAK